MRNSLLKKYFNLFSFIGNRYLISDSLLSVSGILLQKNNLNKLTKGHKKIKIFKIFQFVFYVHGEVIFEYLGKKIKEKRKMVVS